MMRNVDLAEELAQDALVAALAEWPASGVPANPGAWLMAAAKRWAAQILGCSPMSIRASKETVMRGLTEHSVKAALENQRKYDAARAFQGRIFRRGPETPG